MHERRRGIAHARNATIEAALALDADFIAFTDAAASQLRIGSAICWRRTVIYGLPLLHGLVSTLDGTSLIQPSI